MYQHHQLPDLTPRSEVSHQPTTDWTYSDLGCPMQCCQLDANRLTVDIMYAVADGIYYYVVFIYLRTIHVTLYYYSSRKVQAAARHEQYSITGPQ